MEAPVLVREQATAMSATVEWVLGVSLIAVGVGTVIHQLAMRRLDRALNEYRQILDDEWSRLRSGGMCVSLAQCVQTCHRLEQAEAHLADAARREHPSVQPSPPPRTEGSPS